MFEAFSSGYYLGRLFVEPSPDDRAAIHEMHHETVNRQLYTDGEGVERLDNPLVMKLDATHFPVHGDDRVPEGTLAVPEEILEDASVRNPPELTEVLLAKAEHAQRLVEYGAVAGDGDYAV